MCSGTTFRISQDRSSSKLVVAVAAIVASLFVLPKLLRYLLSTILPDKGPGEPNTILLATPRANTADIITAKDLENVRTYDYIIVGTGTAGAVLARRLSEDPSVNVLAIESDHSDLKQLFSRIPAAFPNLFWTVADWALQTQPEENCHGRRMFWPSGRMLGGSSAMNAMIYNVGAPDDWDKWASLGLDGWSFADVDQYRKKAECFKPRNVLNEEELHQHGLSGPWQIGYVKPNALSGFFVDACASLGFMKTRDINSKQGTNGVSMFQTFINSKGQRCSTAVAYLTADVCKRPNLEIATGQNVTRIICDESAATPRAVGIEMTSPRNSPVRYLAKARKEVILCAGAVHTPQILKLSGIGPAAELTKQSISVVQDLAAVGANLADHLCTPIVAKVAKGTSLQFLTAPIPPIGHLIRWLCKGTGAFATNASEAAAYCRVATRADCPANLRTEDLSSGPSSSDLEIIEIAAKFLDHGREKAENSGDYMQLGAILLRPESRGTIELASSDVFDHPLIRANYLSSQHDLDMLTYGCRLARSIMKANPLDTVFEGWYAPQMEDPNQEELAEHVRKSSETIYHPMCTARMGRNPSDSVVNAELKVHGVDGLRVVDASIFLAPMACHPCGHVVTVAEKAADLIKADLSRYEPRMISGWLTRPSVYDLCGVSVGILLHGLALAQNTRTRI